MGEHDHAAAIIIYLILTAAVQLLNYPSGSTIFIEGVRITAHRKREYLAGSGGKLPLKTVKF